MILLLNGNWVVLYVLDFAACVFEAAIGTPAFFSLHLKFLLMICRLLETYLISADLYLREQTEGGRCGLREVGRIWV